MALAFRAAPVRFHRRRSQGNELCHLKRRITKALGKFVSRPLNGTESDASLFVADI
jgi:hypothetical protein